MIPASEAVALTQRPTQIYLEGRLPMVIEAMTAKQLGLQDGQVIAAKTQAQGARWWFQFQNGLKLDIPPEWAGMSRLIAGETVGFKAIFQADGSILLRPYLPTPPLPAVVQAESPQAPVPQPMDNRTSQLMWRPKDLNALLDVLKPGVLETLAQRAGETPTTLAQWWIHRPFMAQLSTEQLRRWITMSGWLNEALMAQGKPPPGSDTKTALRALIQSLRQSQDGQAQWLEDALSDIESSQLANVVSQGQEQVMGMVLAFADAGPVKLKFKKGHTDPQDPSHGWLVDLELNEKELGHIWLRSRISQGNQLELIMWAEEIEVADMAKAQASKLRQLLQEAAIQVNSFHVYHGSKPVEDTHAQDRQFSGRLVDIRS
jgi:Flagellar hook-length control protein FliK